MSKVLQELLKRRPTYCAVVNKYAEPAASEFLSQLGYQKIPNLPPPLTCFSSQASRFPPSPQTRENLLYYYAIDTASLLPVLALQPQTNDVILDICAAPGGKAFALLQLLSLGEDGGGLALNDTSPSRLGRLRSVISQCIPQNLRHSVRFTRRKGEEWADIEPRAYDKVLLDAPCSSDRHHVDHWAKTGRWYPETEHFSLLQSRLLLASLWAVRVGGTVVYCTCSMSDKENGDVISTTVETAKSRGIAVDLSPPQEMALSDHCHQSRTLFGTLVIPTSEKNCGPLFVASLQVTSSELA